MRWFVTKEQTGSKELLGPNTCKFQCLSPIFPYYVGPADCALPGRKLKVTFGRISTESVINRLLRGVFVRRVLPPTVFAQNFRPRCLPRIEFAWNIPVIITEIFGPEHFGHNSI